MPLPNVDSILTVPPAVVVSLAHAIEHQSPSLPVVMIDFFLCAIVSLCFRECSWNQDFSLAWERIHIRAHEKD